ncbi:MAG: hypothetical protein HeimC2_36440 [Candidatus Heimdallarchaeota archaeon LC_2]|nr:MAG: hypothetical protein HeimC2_36440 [Candidatus Heimdallarchaeota archaeon LC_2]
MSSTYTVQFVTNYLTNFFDEASEDQIKSVVEKTDSAIIQVIETLIDNDISFQEILEITTRKIEKLEDDISKKDKELRKLELKSPSKTTIDRLPIKHDTSSNYMVLEKLKTLKSATYNAKLFPICLEIFKRYFTLNQPTPLKQIHKEFGQDRVITSFKLQKSFKSSSISKLLNELFIIESKNGELMATPSATGMSVYQLSLEYYSDKSIFQRFDDLLLKGKLADSKKLLIKQICESQTSFTNNTTDKILMASFCGIHKDNISKYLVQLVKFGLINRVPVEYSNNLFTYHCFNDSIIEKLK